MTRTCTVCTHPKRAEIDKALADGQTPYRTIADRYSLSGTALKRHRSGHLPAKLAKAHDARDAAEAQTVLDKLRWAEAETRELYAAAKDEGDVRTALLAMDRALKVIEMLGEIAGELSKQATVNILVNPQWVHTQTVMLQALAPYPEAKAAVVAALKARG